MMEVPADQEPNQCQVNHKPMSAKMCAALNCNKRQTPGVEFTSYFRFPKNKKRSEQWVTNMRRPELKNKTMEELNNSYRLCAEHFEDCMFMNQQRKKLVWDAVPTLFQIPNPPKRVTPQRRLLIRHPDAQAARKNSRPRCILPKTTPPASTTEKHGPPQLIEENPAVETSSRNSMRAKEEVLPTVGEALPSGENAGPSAVEQPLVVANPPSALIHVGLVVVKHVGLPAVASSEPPATVDVPQRASKHSVEDLKRTIRKQARALSYLRKKVDKLKAKPVVQATTATDVLEYIAANFVGRQKAFLSSQISSSQFDKRGVRFDEDTMQIALTVFNESRKTYNYLREIFSLPTKFTLYRYLKSNRYLTSVEDAQDLTASVAKVENPTTPEIIDSLPENVDISCGPENVENSGYAENSLDPVEDFDDLSMHVDETTDHNTM